jgi:hypothetical protein
MAEPMETMPESVGSQLKWMAWRCAWYAANTACLYFADAEKDQQALIGHYEAAQVEVTRLSLPIPVSVVKDMAMASSKYTSSVRISHQADAAKAAQAEFEAAALTLQGCLSVPLALHLKWMCWRASWHGCFPWLFVAAARLIPLAQRCMYALASS